MIKLEKTQVVGLEPAIRGMRNPMNSWEKSDTVFFDEEDQWTINGYSGENPHPDASGYNIGPDDRDLMMRLAKGGSVHAKYRRMIVVYVDITAPLYWWKEFDTYKVGTVANSCSTMHKIQAKPFELDDFSYDHLFSEDQPDDEKNAMLRATLPSEKYDDEEIYPLDILDQTIDMLNKCRTSFNVAIRYLKEATTEEDIQYWTRKKKKYWWQMIQLLPSSYNQKRTIMLNYEVLAGIYLSRKDHKLDEWHDFCDWINDLPYSEVIIGE